jgi:hypothetical protein
MEKRNADDSFGISLKFSKQESIAHVIKMTGPSSDKNSEKMHGLLIIGCGLTILVYTKHKG